MGHSLELFLNKEKVDEEFICIICTCVMEDPVMIDACEHIFCNACLTHWNQTHKNCPLDRLPISHKFRPPHRSYLCLLNKHVMRCKFDSCPKETTLGEIEHHYGLCDHNPENVARECQQNCGAKLKPSQLAGHNCIEYLKEKLQASAEKNQQVLSRSTAEHQKELQRFKSENGKLKYENQLLKYRLGLAQAQAIEASMAGGGGGATCSKKKPVSSPEKDLPLEGSMSAAKKKKKSGSGQSGVGKSSGSMSAPTIAITNREKILPAIASIASPTSTSAPAAAAAAESATAAHQQDYHHHPLVIVAQEMAAAMNTATATASTSANANVGELPYRQNLSMKIIERLSNECGSVGHNWRCESTREQLLVNKMEKKPKGGEKGFATVSLDGFPAVRIYRVD